MNNDRINAALAISEKYGAVVSREVVVSMPRVCAVRNRHYAAIYIALPNGRYRFKECAPSVSGAAGNIEMQNIDLSLIDNGWRNVEKCLWCGNKVVARCGKCRQFVCCGRVTGNVFTCCDACGCEAVLSGSYSSFTGSKERFTAALKAPSDQTASLAPARNELMLTSGGKR